MERESGEPAAGRVAGPAGDHIDLSRGTFHAPVIGAQYTYGSVPTPVAPADTWPRLRAVRRLSLGIRPVRRLGDESPLPPYVRRDADAALDRIVGERLGAGGLVVVTGEPLSGKSRTAWAALRRVGGGVSASTTPSRARTCAACPPPCAAATAPGTTSSGWTTSQGTSAHTD
ncbi:hypothetical protein ACIBBD_26340 [Streptomyces sp. NPDC051315]|uniref:hypothetical protein n=1 Tax=Streptomyces sp. NPDC051315 TaxID=3365650 RepID=UPI00379DB9CC